MRRLSTLAMLSVFGLSFFSSSSAHARMGAPKPNRDTGAVHPCDGHVINDLFLAASSADGPLDARISTSEAHVVYGAEIVPPTADIITPSTTGPTNASSISVTITFSEPVVNFDNLADLTFTTTGNVVVGAMSLAGGLTTYTVTLSALTGQGTFAVSVNLSSDVVDLANNPLLSSVTSAVVTIDRQPPAAPMILTNNGSDFTVGINPVTLKGITDADTNSLRLNGTPIPGYMPGSVNWSVPVTLNLVGATPLSFTARDAIGNVSSTATIILTYDALSDADGDTLLDSDEGEADVDNDGIPNYLDTDSDGDDVSDFDETQLGTDPYDANSVPLPLIAWPLGLALAGAALLRMRKR